MPYATEGTVTCPKCSGDMWDNRMTKRNPKQPDFRCKDKGCEGVIWPPKNGTPPRAAAPQNNVKQPYSAGGPLPWEQQETGAAPRDAVVILSNGITGQPYRSPAPIVQTGHGLQITDKLDYVFALYSACLDHVLAVEVPKLMKAEIGASPESVSAMTSTLLIQASKP